LEGITNVLWFPTWQNQATFSDLNYSLTGGIGHDKDGWDLGLFTDESVFDANDTGVIGNQLWGVTYLAGIRGPEANGIAGLTGNKLGLEGGINPAGSVYAGYGVNLHGFNISETLSAGLAYQLGISIGVQGIDVSIPYFSDYISF
jgi:hypothetical protein